MRVYMSGGISMREEIRRRANELRATGIEVTSRWLDERLPNLIWGGASDEAMAAHAVRDITDIDRSHYYVYHSHDDARYRSRGGGAHFETGYAYARDIPIVVVGQPRNVFHFLPHGESGILRLETWEEAHDFLVDQAMVPVAGYFASIGKPLPGHYGSLQPIYADQEGDVDTGVSEVTNENTKENSDADLAAGIEEQTKKFREMMNNDFSRIMGKDHGPLFLDYLKGTKSIGLPAQAILPGDREGYNNRANNNSPRFDPNDLFEPEPKE